MGHSTTRASCASVASFHSAFGSTDDIGWKSVVNPVHWHDFHATVLHLLGIDHERLTYYHNGLNRRLTDVHGNVLKALLS